MKIPNVFKNMARYRLSQKQSQKQKLTTLTKGIMVAAGASMVGLVIYLTTFLNTASVSESKAEIHARTMMGYEVGDGDIIASFEWDGKTAGNATMGPDAISMSQSATIAPDGSNETSGLSAGADKQDINIEIPATKEFNTEGIDISFDFRRMEESCDFYSRGNYFNFGMKKGKICISYKVSIGDGKGQMIDEVTKYEIPMDENFRNYRFLYNPQSGKGEIFANGVTVWSHKGPEEAPLLWKSNDNVIIARGMNGNGMKKVILDNLVIRSTAHVNKMPIHLLNFEAVNQSDRVMIRWFTGKEMDTDSFRVERSLNGTDFESIGSIKAAGNSTSLQAYALIDMHPVEGVAAYYRLVPTNKPLKSITVPVIGYKYRKDHIENMPIEKVEAAIKEQQQGAATK